MQKGQFVLEVSQDCIVDLAKIDKKTWNGLKKTVSLLVKSQQVEDIGMAYIAAFLIYVQELVISMPDYNPKKDKLM